MRFTAYALNVIVSVLPGSARRMIEIIGTDEFEQWYLALDDKDAEAVAFTVGLLEHKGVALGFPYSSDLKGAQMGHLQELRIQSRGHRLRALMRSTRSVRRCSCSAATRPAMIAFIDGSYARRAPVCGIPAHG